MGIGIRTSVLRDASGLTSGSLCLGCIGVGIRTSVLRGSSGLVSEPPCIGVHRGW